MNKNEERKSGVLMNISSLPGPFGIGVFGEEARAFARKLKAMGFSYWQILPLGTLDRGNSPYCGDSAFAGNELYIDPRELRKEGLLTDGDVTAALYHGTPYTCDYDFVRHAKEEMLAKAFAAYKSDKSGLFPKFSGEFSAFVRENPWVGKYAAYRALKDKNGGRPWYEWPDADVENLPESVGKRPQKVDNSPINVGNLPENVDKSGTEGREDLSKPPESANDATFTVGNLEEIVGKSAEIVENFSGNVGNSVPTGENFAENEENKPKNVGNPQNIVGNSVTDSQEGECCGISGALFTEIKNCCPLDIFRESDLARAEYYAFVQFLFFREWRKLKTYVNGAGIRIIGDMPLYVAYDSSDVWGYRQLFCLEEDGRTLSGVAGVPPDYFSEEGQLWGNPLYDWKTMEKDGFSWWKQRVSVAMKCYDVLRIDHFRGLASYWKIPGGEKTAVNGSWQEGPGMKLFSALEGIYGEGQIIAEDLGVFGEDVEELLRATGFAGMKVIQFGFDESRDSLNLPHKYGKNSIAYTGTHDNNTVLGWLYEAAPGEREYALAYCGFKGDWTRGGYDSPSVRAVIETVMRTASRLVIVPLQDLCGFGRDARMNIPGEPDGNWRYRADQETIDNIDAAYFYGINRLFSRL